MGSIMGSQKNMGSDYGSNISVAIKESQKYRFGGDISLLLCQ